MYVVASEYSMLDVGYKAGGWANLRSDGFELLSCGFLIKKAVPGEEPPFL